MSKEYALTEVRAAYNLLEDAQCKVRINREYFSRACREAHEEGVSDQQISDLTKGGYSRARIQQFRAGERKKVAIA